MLLNRIALTCPTEKEVELFKELGFDEKNRTLTSGVVEVELSNGITIIKVIVDNKFMRNDSTMCGMELCFQTEHLQEVWQRLLKYNPSSVDKCKGCFYLTVFSGLRVKIKEYIPHAPTEIDGLQFE